MVFSVILLREIGEFIMTSNRSNLIPKWPGNFWFAVRSTLVLWQSTQEHLILELIKKKLGTGNEDSEITDGKCYWASSSSSSSAMHAYVDDRGFPFVPVVC